MKTKINSKGFREWIFLIALLLIGAIVYRVWISFSVFVNADWDFFFRQSLISNFFPSIWVAGTGGINVILWRYPFDFLNGVFGHLGFDSNVAEKYLYFWPIIIVTPISSFLLVKKITKSNLAGFVGSLIFSYNTYFLAIDTEGHELLTVAYAWAAFAILAFMYLMKTKKKLFIPLTALLLFIVGSYDLRSLYVTAGAITLYALYHQLIIEKKWLTNLKINLQNFFLTFFVLALLSLYWILPFLAANSLTGNSILSREMLEDFYNLQSAIALFYPFWAGTQTTWFFVQNIPFFFWLYPILALIGLIIGKKNKQVGFFGLLAITGIFLTKQDAPPFSAVYTFLYSYIPGFSAFREASKFYFLIALSYAVLIGVFTVYIWNFFKSTRYIKYLFVFLIVLLPLWNTVPFLTGTIKTMFVPKTVPDDLESVNSYLSTQSEYSKIFWASGNSYWIISNNNHPVIEGSFSAIEDWANQASINLTGLNLDSDQKTNNQEILEFVKSDTGKRMLSLGSFGYMVLSDKDNNLTTSNPNMWKGLRYSLDKIGYLQEVNLGERDTLVFKNKIQRPHIYLTFEKESITKDVAYSMVDFKQYSPSEYVISLKNINKPFYLNFSDYYDSNWNLYVGKFNWFNVLSDKQKAVSKDAHFENVAGFNSYYIDPKRTCLNIESCKVNKDGSINISFTLLFKPQAYLYLGLVISTLTLLGTLFAALYFYKNKI